MMISIFQNWISIVGPPINISIYRYIVLALSHTLKETMAKYHPPPHLNRHPPGPLDPPGSQGVNYGGGECQLLDLSQKIRPLWTKTLIFPACGQPGVSIMGGTLRCLSLLKQGQDLEGAAFWQFRVEKTSFDKVQGSGQWDVRLLRGGPWCT